jgi:hypothetical protein
MVTIAVKGEKKYLDKKDKTTLIGFFFKINGIPIIMIIFSIIFFEECFILSNICLLIIALYSSAIVLASMFLCGVEADTGEYIAHSNSCSMCKRMIINAGIKTVYVRDTKDEYREIDVQSWIEDDESLIGARGY